MVHKLIGVAGAGLLLSLVVTTGDVGAQGPLRNGNQSIPAGTARPHTGPLPPMPRVSFDPPRPMPVVQQVYEFAARHPEVLQYVPCYCGCERLGHNANHSCFVKSRSADGRVTEWDSHGLGCTICLDVARDAMTLFNSGSNTVAIRAAIDKKYGSYFPSSTPTPRPVR